MTEIWKKVVGYEGLYEVSSLGRVLSKGSVRRDGRIYWPKMLSQNIQNGYPTVALKGRRVYVHRLVAEAFLGPCPPDKHQVNHKDGNKANPAASNLEWVTRSENVQHAIKSGLQPRVTGGAFRKGGTPWNKGKRTGKKPWNYILDRSCKNKGCDGEYYCRGMCQKCHAKWRYERDKRNGVYLAENDLLPSEPTHEPN